MLQYSTSEDHITLFSNLHSCIPTVYGRSNPASLRFCQYYGISLWSYLDLIINNVEYLSTGFYAILLLLSAKYLFMAFAPFFWWKVLFIFCFLAVLDLSFCLRAFSSCGEQELPLVAVCGRLTAGPSLAVEHRPGLTGFSGRTSQALELRLRSWGPWAPRHVGSS